MDDQQRKKPQPYTDTEREAAKLLGISPAAVRKTYSKDLEQGLRVGLAAVFVDIVENYNEAYFDTFPGKAVDRQLWGALHLGLMTGLLLGGYSNEQCEAAREEALKELSSRYGETGLTISPIKL